MITSRQHVLVKAFRDAARGRGRLALVDGWHLVADASAAGIAFETVCIAGSPPDAHAAHLLARIGAAGVPVVRVSSSVLDALSPVRTPSGIVALVRRPALEAAALTRPPHALVVVAVDLQDPGNAGALLRSAEAGGATGTAFAGRAADPWGWKALRAAMGSTFRLPAVRAPDGMALCDALAGAGLRLIAAAPGGGTSMHAADLTGRLALLLGGEGAGLPRAYLERADAMVSIPMRAPVESLNVAVAGALLVYEAARQRARARA